MDISLIGNQIQKFRKALGLTQRELGAAIGVSTQAVSQWENGGAPDVSLLPAIADKLGVTVDALFGREGGEVRDINALVVAWLRSKPENERHSEMAKLVWRMSVYGLHPMDMPELGYMKNCEVEICGGRQIMKSLIATDGGYMLGVAAEDLSLMGIFPEPEEGYVRFFADNEEYRQLFALLAEPGALEILLYLCSHPESSFYTASSLSKSLDLPEDRIRELLERLSGICEVTKINLNVDEGEMCVWGAPNQGGIVPFLLYARLFANKVGGYFVNLGRPRPCLMRREDWKHEKK